MSKITGGKARVKSFSCQRQLWRLEYGMHGTHSEKPAAKTGHWKKWVPKTSMTEKNKALRSVRTKDSDFVTTRKSKSHKMMSNPTRPGTLLNTSFPPSTRFILAELTNVAVALRTV